MTSLRPYQQQIVEDVSSALSDGGIGQLHMACGSGKTLVGQKVGEAVVPPGGTTIVLTPSLALISQTLDTWRATSAGGPQSLAVCSDDTVGDAPVHVGDLPVPATTSVAQIRSWLEQPATGRRLVVGTYLSADRLAEAVRAVGRVDLLVLDEAHHLSGPADAATRRVLDRDWLPAQRRLFMTATPRMDLRASSSSSVVRMSMDDEGVFGPVLSSYPFARGIAEGYLDDYRIAVVGVPDSQARKLLADERAEYVDALGAPSLQTTVAQVALARAREQYGVRRVLTFHPRVSQAAEFCRTLSGTVERVAPGTVHYLHSDHVHGEMDHRVRQRILDHLRYPPGGGWSVISNSRCLGEGVDVPTVDAVLFAHPKRSAVDIVQAVGRALRRHQDVPGPSTIIVPIVVPDSDGEIGDLEAGDYTTLWQVVRALRAHDHVLGAELDRQRSHASTRDFTLPDKITLLLPEGTSQRIFDQVSLLLVQQSSSSWWEGYGEARRYYAEHGHLNLPAEYRTENGLRLGAWLAQRRHERRNGRLPADRIAKLDELGMVWDVTESRHLEALSRLREWHGRHGRLPRQGDDKSLSAWLSRWRAAYWSGTLNSGTAAVLEELGMVWETWQSRHWSEGIRHAREFYEEYGHLNPSKDYRAPDGYALGAWVGTQRVRRGKGQLSEECVAELEALGVVWDREDAAWWERYAEARRFWEERGHLDVPHAYVTDGGVRLGSWVLHQRQLRSGVKPGGISNERVEALDAIGMRWSRGKGGV